MIQQAFQTAGNAIELWSIDLPGISSMPKDIQYVSDSEGKAVGVIVPIELWREIESERETAYLLRSAAMRERLLEAKDRDQDLSFEEVRENLGL